MGLFFRTFVQRTFSKWNAQIQQCLTQLSGLYIIENLVSLSSKSLKFCEMLRILVEILRYVEIQDYEFVCEFVGNCTIFQNNYAEDQNV